MSTDPGTPWVQPLRDDDPAKIGDFWVDAVLTEAPSGITYTGHGEDGLPVLLILLSEGAAADAAARDRFAGAVNELHIDTVVARGGHGQDEGRLGRKFRTEEDDPVEPDDLPLAPWVALVNDGSPAAAAEAQRLLSRVDLSRLSQQGRPAGPDYRLHWIEQVKPGFSRVWPLPWPGRYDRAGWPTIIISWLLMLLIALLAVVTVIVLFKQAPEQQPPPPVPTSQTGSPPPQSGSPSPQSGSPSPSSASPSPQSGSPSPSESGSPSGSPSPSPSGSQSASPSPQSGSPSPASGSPSAVGSPTPNSKL